MSVRVSISNYGQIQDGAKMVASIEERKKNPLGKNKLVYSVDLIRILIE